MEPDGELNPDTDDLPLRANTNHILVRHYVLDLTACFDKKVISGSIVLFLEPCSAETAKTKDDIGPETGDGARQEPNEEGTKFGSDTQGSDLFQSSNAEDFTLVLDCCDLEVSKVEEVDTDSVLAALGFPLTAASKDISADSQAGFIQHLFSMPSSHWKEKNRRFSLCSRSPGVQKSNSLHFHADRWSLKVKKKGVKTSQGFPRIIRIYYMTRTQGGSVRWTKDQDNRECVYTAGSPINNRALFPCQEPPVAMSTWQARVRAPSDCVVLMSGEEEAVPAEDGDTHFLTWNYYVTMPMPASTFTLAVGHWCQVPTETPSALENEVEDGVGCNCLKAELVSELAKSPGEVERGAPRQIGSRDEATSSDSAFCHSSLGHKELSLTDYSGMEDDGISCSHGDYPCRFTERSAWSQRVVPHRVFSPACLLQKAQMGILKLLPQCLAAAHAVLGVHPFPRLDVLIVPAGFSSLGMASVICRVTLEVCDTDRLFQEAVEEFRAGRAASRGLNSFGTEDIAVNQTVKNKSVLCKECPGSGLSRLTLSGSRICHEISHSWFGLVIGARDWTEEWISEGFATFLEDIIWAQAQQLSSRQTADQFDLKALLRWRRLSDELQNSNEELQILRPNMERTGQASDSGSSTIKHALNPDKTFMQVHYLKGYFLLRFLASEVGDQHLIDFFRLFVKKFHGQLVLSQDFLQMFLITFPHMERRGLTLSAIYADWLDRPGIPEWLHERSAVWSQARLVEEVKAEVVKWILSSRTHQAKDRKRKRTEPKVNYRELTTEQLVMLLELLLEESELSVSSMRALHKTYDLQKQDAEVRHRWCELVVKHTYSQAYCDVEDFLLHDQAMGVYLYGELMVQEDPEQQALARRCLALVQDEMDQSARRVVEEMIL